MVMQKSSLHGNQLAFVFGWCVFLAGVVLHAGCAPEQLRRIVPPGLFEPKPTVVAHTSVPLRLSPNPDDDEDPTVILGRDGRFYVAWSARQQGRVDILLRGSSDGQTWSVERKLTTDRAEDFYPSLLQSRDGMFHLAWYRLQRRDGKTDILYARSRDGRRWSRAEAITDRGMDWAPTLYEDSQGAVWIVWSSRRMGNREIFAARSVNGGRRWSTPNQLTRSAEEDDFPQVLETHRGERVMAWTRYQSGSRIADFHRDATSEVVMATSRDGVRWSAPILVSPSDPDGRYLDFLPSIFADHERQQLYVSWTSDRTGKKGDILARRIRSASSPVMQLTTGDSSDYSAKIIPAGRPGEYMMVWVSTREGKADILAQRVRF